MTALADWISGDRKDTEDSEGLKEARNHHHVDADAKSKRKRNNMRIKNHRVGIDPTPARYGKVG